MLYDGEEPPGLPENDPDFYRHGAARLARRRARQRAHDAGEILLDYVGARACGCRARARRRRRWRAAARRGAGRRAGAAFRDRTGLTITTTTTPYLRAGVPAVDLIDWSLPRADSCATARRSCPSAALDDALGETIVELVPPHRLSVSRSCARGGAGGPCSAGRRRGARGRCRPRSRSWRRGAATSSSTACSAQARISTSSGESCSISSPASMRATRSASDSSTPSRRRTCGTRLSAKSVSAARSSAGAMPASARSAAAIWARLKNGTSLAVVGRDVAPGGPARELARRAAPRAVAAAGEREEASRRARRGRARRARAGGAANRRHQLVLGVLAERGGDLARRHRGQLAARPRPVARAARLDGAEAGQPGGLRSVGNQPRAEVDRVELQANAARRLVAGAVEVGRRAATRRGSVARVGARSLPRRCAPGARLGGDHAGAVADRRRVEARIGVESGERSPPALSSNRACRPPPPTPSSRA